MGSYCIDGELSPVLCDDAEGQGKGGVEGRSKRERIHVADSRHCTAETNATL